MRDVRLEIPDDIAAFLRETIHRARGNEVFFLGRVHWDAGPDVATLEEVDVMARGNSVSVAAIYERADEWDLAIHNHPGGGLDPSEADTLVAHELGNRSVGFAIIDNEAREHYLVVPPRPREAAVPVDPEEVRRIFSPDGSLARHLPGYEMREAQLDMALEVTRSLNEKQVVACEAGTGVGKSFAYLVPSILWAVANRERVVVSTGTIHLQEQLVGKDLPLLEKALDVEFQYTLIKGRSNYACRRKMNLLPEEFLLDPPEEEEKRALEDLVEWARTTRDGSLADLAWIPPPSIWERVMSETDKSLKVNCPHYQECFFYEAKRRAFQAQIVVANHHLFFSDLAVRRVTGNYTYDLILPGYRRVVFDEAHHLEDVSSDHLGLEISRRGLRQRLGRLRSRDGQRGTLVMLSRQLDGWGDPVAAHALRDGYAERLPRIAERIDECFLQIGDRVEEETSPWRSERGPGESDPGASTLKVRFRPDRGVTPLWEALRAHVGEIRREFERISRLNDDALTAVRGARVPDEKRDIARLELESFGGRIESLLVDLDRFRDYEDASQVRWLEYRPPSGRKWPAELTFHAAPIRVAEELNACLYEPLESVILTSATLSVEGNARFLGDRLGFSLVEGNRFAFRSFDSPFRFEEQVLTVLPTDLPAPNTLEYTQRLAPLILDLLRASRGRAFVLFTSYSLLRRMHAALEGPLAELGLRALAQGQAPRTELLRRFRDGENSVLFGTDSFWEGVDVKGRALECVIITRLPFRVPSEPLQEARLEDVSARGLHPFRHYTIPQAVLRFKQGFGRLIRSNSDRGVVAVLDSRVLTRPYGKTFLASLPLTGRAAVASRVAVRRVEEFFAAARDDPQVDAAPAPEETGG